MFPEMRRKNQSLTEAAATALLVTGSSGVLAVAGADGYPYAVPLSYAYQNGKLYFHCSPKGHKLEAIRREPKVSFCVIGQDAVVPEEYTTYFRSVICFGKARLLEDASEKRQAIALLTGKYCPGVVRDCLTGSEKLENTCLIEVAVEHITGKEAIELACPKA